MRRKGDEAAKLAEDRVQLRAETEKSNAESLKRNADEATRPTIALEDTNALLAYANQGDIETDSEKEVRMGFITLTRKLHLEASRSRISAIVPESLSSDAATDRVSVAVPYGTDNTNRTDGVVASGEV